MCFSSHVWTGLLSFSICFLFPHFPLLSKNLNSPKLYKDPSNSKSNANNSYQLKATQDSILPIHIQANPHKPMMYFLFKHRILQILSKVHINFPISQLKVRIQKLWPHFSSHSIQKPLYLLRIERSEERKSIKDFSSPDIIQWDYHDTNLYSLIVRGIQNGYKKIATLWWLHSIIFLPHHPKVSPPAAAHLQPLCCLVVGYPSKLRIKSGLVSACGVFFLSEKFHLYIGKVIAVVLLSSLLVGFCFSL